MMIKDCADCVFCDVHKLDSEPCYSCKDDDKWEPKGSALRKENRRLAAELQAVRDELKELRESVEWIKSVPPEEKMDQELHAASLLDLRRWERSRGPGAVGNPVLHYEDFLAFRARERGRKEAQDAMSNLQDELAAAHEEILLSRQREGETMADLLRTRDELAKHGPSCDRCQSSHCCSVAE